MRNIPMKTDLTAIEDTLAGLTDIELHALKVASNEVPQIATGRLAWIEGACDWELNRRPGFDDTLTFDILGETPTGRTATVHWWQ